jgi:hypothetical protein
MSNNGDFHAPQRVEQIHDEAASSKTLMIANRTCSGGAPAWAVCDDDAFGIRFQTACA